MSSVTIVSNGKKVEIPYGGSGGITIDQVNEAIDEKLDAYTPMEVYSTEETVIGRWIDGKPLYGKVIIADNLQPGNHMIESFPIADYFCVSRFRYLRTDGYSMLSSGADIAMLNGVINGAVPYMTPQSGLMVNINYYTISRLIMDVEYTKHADQATIELPAMLSSQNNISFNMDTQAMPTAAVTADNANISVDQEV